MKCVVDAHREFFRIADVTERISESKTCFLDTVRRVAVDIGKGGSQGALESEFGSASDTKQADVNSFEQHNEDTSVRTQYYSHSCKIRKTTREIASDRYKE